MLDKVKELKLPMGVWQDNIHEALSKIGINAHTTCNYPDKNTVHFTILEPCDEEYNGVVVAKFALSFLPGCSGVLVSHALYVAPRYRNRGIAQILQPIKFQIAKDLNTSVLLATVNADNAAEKTILERFKWVILKKFLNIKTGNSIEIVTVDVHNEDY